MNTLDIVVASIVGTLLIVWLIYDVIRNITNKKNAKN